jgi:hypothetical protein
MDVPVASCGAWMPDRGQKRFKVQQFKVQGPPPNPELETRNPEQRSHSAGMTEICDWREFYLT